MNLGIEVLDGAWEIADEYFARVVVKTENRDSFGIDRATIDTVSYQGKGMGWRLLLYPLSAVIVPLFWFLWTRSPQRRATVGTYPHLIDICVVAPFLIDTAGNAANLYDSVEWWDDAMHVVTWVPWVMAAGLALRRLPLSRLNVAALTVGFGAVTHIIWEVLEYLTFVRDNPSESATAYEDTIGDLVASLSGSVIGAIIVTTVLWDLGGRDAGHQAAGAAATHVP